MASAKESIGMTAYEHTQQATVLLIAMAIATLVAVIVAMAVSPIALGIVPVFILAAWLFSSLTIEITDDRLRWRFGPGLFRREVPLADIEFAEPVRTNVLEGWGIHVTRFGWLYNVSGFDAIAVRLNNGKRFALGTDEPDAFLAALGKPRPASARPVSHGSGSAILKSPA